jgi:hypothetical protein
MLANVTITGLGVALHQTRTGADLFWPKVKITAHDEQKRAPWLVRVASNASIWCTAEEIEQRWPACADMVIEFDELAPVRAIAAELFEWLCALFGEPS